MKHLSIVVPEAQSSLATIACLVGTYEILSRANARWKANGGKEQFKIELVGISSTTEFHDGLFSAKPQATIDTVKKTNLIIIPSLAHDYQKAIQGNQLLMNWMEKQYKQGAELASICTGTFMLAHCGFLEGKSCSTHWSAAAAFRNLFPNVKLLEDKLITDENGIYTNGGAYSFLNLVIYLIEKYFDRQTAIYCAKVFQIEIDRESQSAFTIFTGQKIHGDEMVKKAQAYIEGNLQEKISVEHLSSQFAVGRRNFDRRFIKATGNTPLEYSQRVKIESAKKSFESTRKTVNEVMYEVGYNDIKAFREVFRKITGMSPLEYRAKYNKEAVV